MRKICFILFLLGIKLSLFAQNGTNFRSPLDIPLVLSGNFGELRSDHFHSGVDFKTQGISGHKVYAIEDGYVSRIKVQAGGYGHALYIAHPNGYTSVYGHLSAYNSAIGNHTKKIQYDRESFEVDLYLKPGTLPVSKGELIALSGNTGSSSGPHLHFEIRKTANQHPTNALMYNLPVKDDIAPRFSHLVIYPRGDDAQVNMAYKNAAFTLMEEEGSYRINGTNPVTVFGKIGFGVEVYDYLNGARNRCGVYALELKVDGHSYFKTEMGEFSFSESRFINAHIDYARKKENEQSIQRLYKLPYNELSIYRHMEEEGLVEIRDTLVHEVEIIAADVYGNTSSLAFEIKGAGALQQMAKKEKSSGTVLSFNSAGGFEDKDIKLAYPAYAFYEDVNFTYARTSGLPDTESDIFHVHADHTPVHKRFKLSLKLPDSLGDYGEKVCLVAVGDDNEISCVGGEIGKGFVNAELRTFGKYALAIDTIAPEIEAMNLSAGKDMSASKSIRFNVIDEMSGIKSYKGYIDNKWILMQYDPKNDLLTYVFDEARITPDKDHEIELYVEDWKGNTSFYHTTFYR